MDCNKLVWHDSFDFSAKLDLEESDESDESDDNPDNESEEDDLDDEDNELEENLLDCFHIIGLLLALLGGSR